jgi:hypothetical protein
MKTKLLITLFLTAAAPTLLHAQGGSLTPPAGPIEPTMKSLDIIEARIAVNDTTCPGNASSVHIISQPGSYYLTANVATESKSVGILITSDDVFLDLNGFSIIRLTGTAGNAIDIGSRKRIHIFNGKIIGGTTQTGGVFTPAGWQDGISSTQPTSTMLVVSDIHVMGVRRRGIFGGWATSNRIERCIVDTCGEMGITGSWISDCVVRNTFDDAINAGNGSSHGLVRNCYAQSVGTGEGIAGSLTDIEHSKGFSVSGIGVWGSSVSNSSGISQSGTGMVAVNATNCVGTSETGTNGMNISGTASYCRATRSNGVAMTAGIAIGCTSGGGTITSAQKHLGTP